ncbi:STAS domain-containing protein [Frankia sp. EI5c]|uniref:STAS domain-containing protein n=1 Tax=Frankia sp. EI5c TaxID=683316 RepID=UPI0007C2B75C|nr:STAS domain-containing protein [Frankia sp. EI5c]OAA28562.1 STAS domain-containing protein [Frankia sp. EI5c]
MVLRLPATLRRDDISGLCGRWEKLLGGRPGTAVLIDATAVTRVDLVAVEAVARLALLARRYDRAPRVDAPARLRDLLALAGLAGLVDRPPPDPALPRQP